MISSAERERRHRGLRAAMQSAGLDALVIAGQAEASLRGYVRYASDWHLWGGSGYVLLPLDSDPVVLLGSASQTFWASEIGWVTDVRRSGVMVDDIVSILKERRVAPHRVGVVGLDRIMSVHDARQLETDLGVAPSDATDLMDSVMVRKSAEEHGYLEETSLIVARAMRRFKEVLASGKTERQVVAECHCLLREAGCLDGIAHISHKAPPYIHPPTDRVIDRRDIIKMSMEFAGPSGYWIELASIFSFGDPPDRERRIYETTRDAFHAASKLMRPGAVAADLPALIEATFRDRGWDLAGRAIWDVHGIGLNVIEPPVVLPGNPTVLEAGMALNMHPGLLVGDDQWGVYIQDNFIVTPTGGRRLSGWDHEWQIIS